ncbi:MAG TPA: hypothetical protein VLM79_36350 [Kofleriaceae bacterium]|nr:hypothetical protein [Kofleriaceae bacterium]
MRWIAMVGAVLVALAGCTTYQSTYRRTRLDGRELVWAYRDRFQVTRDGKVLAEQGDWDGLPSALACVPAARIHAERAADRDSAGRSYFWTGTAILIAGYAAAAAFIATDPHDVDHALLGLASAGVGGLVGLPLVLWGSDTRARANMTAIDAVNVFNDERASCSAGPPVR